MAEEQLISLEQPTQQINNIVLAINSLLGAINAAGGAWVERTVGHTPSGATGTAFTATGHQVIDFIQVASVSGASTISINWVDSSGPATFNLVTGGVIGAAYPLIVPGPFSLDNGDTITYTGANTNLRVVITYREANQ
jgi:hypothetical protein